jgi:hypothetical protein
MEPDQISKKGEQVRLSLVTDPLRQLNIAGRENTPPKNGKQIPELFSPHIPSHGQPAIVGPDPDQVVVQLELNGVASLVKVITIPLRTVNGPVHPDTVRNNGDGTFKHSQAGNPAAPQQLVHIRQTPLTSLRRSLLDLRPILMCTQ